MGRRGVTRGRGTRPLPGGSRPRPCGRAGSPDTRSGGSAGHAAHRPLALGRARGGSRRRRRWRPRTGSSVNPVRGAFGTLWAAGTEQVRANGVVTHRSAGRRSGAQPCHTPHQLGLAEDGHARRAAEPIEAHQPAIWVMASSLAHIVGGDEAVALPPVVGREHEGRLLLGEASGGQGRQGSDGQGEAQCQPRQPWARAADGSGCLPAFCGDSKRR